MSGVNLTRHGGPEALEWHDDFPVPLPSAGQVKAPNFELVIYPASDGLAELSIPIVMASCLQ